MAVDLLKKILPSMTMALEANNQPTKLIADVANFFIL